MSSKNNLQRERQDDSGIILPLVALSIVVIIGAAALTVDIGRQIATKRQSQIAADAGALAAAALLSGTSASNSTITAEATAIAVTNDVAVGNIQTVECGVWDRTTKAFTNCTSLSCTCATPAVNAVRVAISKPIFTTLGKVLGITTLNTTVEAIAMDMSGLNAFCIKPFGFEIAAISGYGNGDTISVGSASPGNWGKLDIGGMMSSGTNFLDAMLEHVCHSDVAIGSSISQGTGFGGSIKNVFDDVVAQGKQNNMVIAIVDSFSNGNSDATILQFCKVDFVSDNNRGGANWVGTFRLVECPTTPPTGNGGVSVSRMLVY